MSSPSASLSPTPPLPAPKDLSVTCPHTGKLVISIRGEPASFLYEFDQTHQKFFDHKCRCQYLATENDLEIVLSWYSKDLRATVLECFNKINDKTQFYIFDVNSGGLKEVEVPPGDVAYKPSDQSQHAVMATIRVNEQEHYVIERSEDGSLKKFFCKYGQYLQMPSLILNTLLLRDIETPAPQLEAPEPDESNDPEDQSWQEYFNSLSLFKFKYCASTNSNLIYALNRKTGEYKSFQYDSGQILYIETPNSNFFYEISEIDLVPLYMEKFNDEDVLFVENVKSQRIEQYVFEPIDRQFVQVYHPELAYNPRKIAQCSMIFQCGGAGNLRFLIGKYPNGRLKVEQFSDDVNSWMLLNPREVRTIVWQKEQKEKARMRRKRPRSGEVEEEERNGETQAKRKKEKEKRKAENSRGNLVAVSPNLPGSTNKTYSVPSQPLTSAITDVLENSTSQLQINCVTMNAPNQQPSTSTALSSSSQIPTFDDECSEFERAFSQIKEQERLKDQEKRNGTASVPIELDSDRLEHCESPPI
ncbi:hypothetical protein CAEBREN_07560 [Caenorhabditis brenneri]|uniref:Uncharacterized protein n=1 Tax=Caenorhabditis brenneri TaxID=135651 RepID=G0NDI3_CAEBE|nr:hypothetical protein CAEBREN_07560 [Caenorhabditis brenneri]